MTSTAEQRAVPAPPTGLANLFTLQGHGLTVTLSLSSITGQPRFDYHDCQQILQFVGEQILFEDTALGRLATVELSAVADLGRTTFTLVIPAVKLVGRTDVPISTIGITTMSRTTIAGPPPGQSTTYAVTALTGSASLVDF
jgi:hypothetical protein